jgi:hypothetical protein
MSCGLLLGIMNTTAIISGCRAGKKTNGAGIVIAVILTSQGMNSTQLKGSGLKGQLLKKLKPG